MGAQFVILTGLSGAGKSRALDAFEDFGYLCVDNLPVALMSRVAAMRSDGLHNEQPIAFVVDVRTPGFSNRLRAALDELGEDRSRYRILFLETSDETLVRRYKETRRRHPLADEFPSVVDCIRAERERLAPIRGEADVVIDTTELSPGQLRDEIGRLFLAPEEQEGLTVTLKSFGFKYGTPLDADTVFDARVLPNPQHVDALRPLTGLDEAVREYALGGPEADGYLQRVLEFIEFVLPHYARERRPHITFGMGCTGGRHRSVAVVEEIARRLGRRGHRVTTCHRDLDKEESS
jgi:UPF0042 nucleotide-binding protein